MKKYQGLFLFGIALWLISCAERGVELSADFDKGSIGSLVEIKPGHFRGNSRHWLKRDSIGDQYYWFYFKADKVKDRSVTFELEHLIGVYRETPHIVYTDYTQPVFSYDQDTWHRITDVHYDSANYTFRFTQQFSDAPVWIAYAHPYPYSRLLSLIDQVRESDYASINTIAWTKEGREVFLVHITDKEVPEADKKNVLILALQHAGEDAGGFMAEGMVSFLTSDKEMAAQSRKKFNYFIVPMMNPDGVYNGTSRYNMEMEDLNNIWMNDEKTQPEVTGVKHWATAWLNQGNELDLFIDIHNHTQFHQYNVFIFQDNTLDPLADVMEKYWPIRIWHSEFRGSSCSYFYSMGIPSGTIELSQSRISEGTYLTVGDYHAYGEGAAIALLEYFTE